MTAPQRLLLIASLALLPACGETNIQAIHRLRPAYSAHRDHILDTLHRLPPPGTLRAWTTPEHMVPPPIFDERAMNDPRATAELVQLEELEGRPVPFTLSLRSPLHFCLAWMGPHNPLSVDVWNDRGGLGEECAAAIARPWLIVVRTAEVRFPESLRMEAFVLDLRINRVVAALPIDVVGRYTEADVGRGPWAEEAERRVHSAFHEAASCEIANQLSRLPGARIALDRRGCEGGFNAIAVPASRVPRAAAAE